MWKMVSEIMDYLVLTEKKWEKESLIFKMRNRYLL